MSKYDRLVTEGAEKRRIIRHLLESLTPEQVMQELVSEGIVPQRAMEIYIAENLTAEKMLERVIRKFSTEGALDDVGAKRYCCRNTVMNPTILPMGGGLDIGDSIRTLDKQLSYKMNNPLRAMSQPGAISGVGTQPPVQSVSRIPTSAPRRTMTPLQPITRTLNLQQSPTNRVGTQRPMLKPLGGPSQPVAPTTQTRPTGTLRPVTQPQQPQQSQFSRQQITRMKF